MTKITMRDVIINELVAKLQEADFSNDIYYSPKDKAIYISLFKLTDKWVYASINEAELNCYIDPVLV